MLHQIKLSKTELGQEWVRAEAKRLSVGSKYFDALSAKLDEIDLSDPGILERFLVEQLTFFGAALPQPVGVYFDNDFGSDDFFLHSRVCTATGKIQLRATGLGRSFRPSLCQTPVTEVFVKVLQHLHRKRRSWLFRLTPDELRVSKCRSILVVGSELFEPNFNQSDLLSHDLQASRLANIFLQSPSVKSWKSYGRFRSAMPFCPLGFGTTWRWRHRFRKLSVSAGLSADSLEYANAIVVLGKHDQNTQCSLDALAKHFAADSLPSAKGYELHAQLTSLQSYIADRLIMLPVAVRKRIQSVITNSLFELSVDQLPMHSRSLKNSAATPTVPKSADLSASLVELRHSDRGKHRSSRRETPAKIVFQQPDRAESKPQHAKQPLGPSMGEKIRDIWGIYTQLDRNKKAEARLRLKEPSSKFVPTRGALGELAR